MRPDQRDASYLWDMLDAAQTVLGFTEGVTPEAYYEDRMLRMAVERGIELIGEAARRVSSSFRAAHPEIPWCRIIAQRNVLIDEYGEVDDERVWELVARHIPALVEQLKRLMPQTPDVAPE